MADPYVVACRKEGLNYAFHRISITMLHLAEVDAALVNAVIDEYRRETLAEGDLKYAEIRTGVFTELGKAMRVELKKMIAGLEADGYKKTDWANNMLDFLSSNRQLLHKKEPTQTSEGTEKGASHEGLSD